MYFQIWKSYFQIGRKLVLHFNLVPKITCWHLNVHKTDEVGQALLFYLNIVHFGAVKSFSFFNEKFNSIIMFTFKYT